MTSSATTSSSCSCSTFKLLSSTLEASTEAVFLLTTTFEEDNDEGLVVAFQNSSVSTLFGNPTPHPNVRGVGGGENNDKLVTFSSFVKMNKSWQDIMMELTKKDEEDDEGTAATTTTNFGSSFQYEGMGIDSSSSLNEEEKNPPNFPVSVTLKKIEPCSCCHTSWICAYVAASNKSSSHTSVRHLVDASFDAMFQIDSHGRITMVNHAAIQLFGYTYSEFMGQNISIICGGHHAAKHNDYMARYLQTGETRIIGKKREVPAKKKNGQEFWVELGIKEITTTKDDDDSHNTENRAFCAFIKDLTEQKEHEKQVQFKEMLTQSIVNSSFDPMFQTDEMGQIVMVNDAAVDLFGWTRDEFIGNNIKMICGGGHHGKHDAYLERYRTTGIRHIIGRKRITKARRKDGTEFDIELGVSETKSSSSNINDGQRYFCGYVRDITRQQMDRQRLRANEAVMKDGFFHGGGASSASHVTTEPPQGSMTDPHAAGKVRGRRLRHAQTIS